MKLITAIIDPEMLSRVMRALHAQPHFPGVTISDAQGQGRGEGEGGKFVSQGKPWAFAKRVRMQIACTDQQCDTLVKTIRDHAHDGQLGHGIILVGSLDHVIRVVGGEEEDAAL
jgi:nitrogen regulatory protein PII